MNDADTRPDAAIDPRREAERDDLCHDPASLRHLAAEGGEPEPILHHTSKNRQD